MNVSWIKDKKRTNIVLDNPHANNLEKHSKWTEHFTESFLPKLSQEYIILTKNATVENIKENFVYSISWPIEST